MLLWQIYLHTWYNVIKLWKLKIWKWKMLERKWSSAVFQVPKFGQSPAILILFISEMTLLTFHTLSLIYILQVNMLGCNMIIHYFTSSKIWSVISNSNSLHFRNDTPLPSHTGSLFLYWWLNAYVVKNLIP